MAYLTLKSNGKYLVRFSLGIRDGKQVQKAIIYTPTPEASEKQAKAEAILFASAIELRIKNGEVTPEKLSANSNNKEIYLSKYISTYYDEIKRKLSPNTYRLYRSICERLIIPKFGNYRVCDISLQHLQAYIDNLGYHVENKKTEKDGLSASTVKRYATVFASIMTSAWTNGIIKENPFRSGKVRFPKIHRSNVDVYTKDEIIAFFFALQSEPPMIRLLLATALLLGLRRAEIVALKWADINFADKYVSVNKSAYKAKGKPQAVKTPKSECSYRNVHFDSEYLSLLITWKNEQEKQNTQCDDYVFTNDKGEWLSLYAPTRICSEFEKRHDIRHLHLHGLRHTYGSLLMSMGVDVETVRANLGHESIRTTQRYIHPYDEKKITAASIINKILEGNNET